MIVPVKVGESVALGIDSTVVARIKILSAYPDGFVQLEIETPPVQTMAEVIETPQS